MKITAKIHQNTGKSSTSTLQKEKITFCKKKKKLKNVVKQPEKKVSKFKQIVGDYLQAVVDNAKYMKR
jgi:hypothetical protein